MNAFALDVNTWLALVPLPTLDTCLDLLAALGWLFVVVLLRRSRRERRAHRAALRQIEAAHLIAR